MSRTLRLLFRRDFTRDRVEKNVHYEGYDFFWPDGRPAAIGLTAFCKHGQRLLGLGRHLAGARERLVELIIFPLPDGEAPLTRLPGHRVRRFTLQRQGRQGRLYFFDGKRPPADSLSRVVCANGSRASFGNGDTALTLISQST